MMKAQRVAQILAGRVPMKKWDGAWAVWDCPCGAQGTDYHMVLDDLPTKDHCFQCSRDYIIFNPKEESA